MYGVLTGLLQPYLLLFVLFGGWHLNRCAGRANRSVGLLVITLPFVALTLLSMPAIAYVSLGTLEWRYPPTEQRPDDASAIVVLGGGIELADATRRRAEMNSYTLTRCLHAARVYRRGKPSRSSSLVAGSTTRPSTPAVASSPRDFLLAQGIDDADLIVEDRSRTTHENAVECRKLLDQRGIDR